MTYIFNILTGNSVAGFYGTTDHSKTDPTEQHNTWHSRLFRWDSYLFIIRAWWGFDYINRKSFSSMQLQVKCLTLLTYIVFLFKKNQHLAWYRQEVWFWCLLITVSYYKFTFLINVHHFRLFVMTSSGSVTLTLVGLVVHMMSASLEIRNYLQKHKLAIV